jgi:ubiquinol-cytochrome c reductase cytochrome b subunit
MQLGDWLDQRSGYRALTRHALEEPVVGGARWAYVFGSALAFLFVLQAVTGILLALYYSASTQEAWGSVYFLSTSVTLGWFVRGLHHWGSSAMIVLLVAHLLQVFVYGAYRAPRELAWWTGLFMLFVTLAFSLTGYLLPWDQKGFWATRVVTSIVGTFPFVGSWLKTTLQGGNDFGNLTLTRFFGFHVFFLPAALTVVLAAHVYLFRRHGVTPRWSRSRAELEAATEPFWPRQLTYDLIFATLVVAVLVFQTLRHHGAPLEAPADPASSYPARPEWYFLWLFELLKVLPGRFEGVLVLGFSLATALFLAALPLVDRAPSASPRGRWPHFLVALVIAGVVGGLTLKSKIEDARDPGVAVQERAAAEETRRAFTLAAKGIPPGGASDLYLNDPLERGKRLFAAQCQSCHAIDGRGGTSAPDLSGYLSRAWVRGVIADPTQPRYFGRTKVTGMDPTDATPEELDVLTDFVLALADKPEGPPGRGLDLYEEKGCHTCHALGKEDPLPGPTLAGYGSRAWIVGAILHPAAASYYGDQNQMPEFAGKLTDEQVDDLLVYIMRRIP